MVVSNPLKATINGTNNDVFIGSMDGWTEKPPLKAPNYIGFDSAI